MAVLGIPLNATTSLSFGLILITTLEMVIHMVTRYNQFHQDVPERILAVKQTVRYLSRPFLDLFCYNRRWFWVLYDYIHPDGLSVGPGNVIGYKFSLLSCDDSYTHLHYFDEIHGRPGER